MAQDVLLRSVDRLSIYFLMKVPHHFSGSSTLTTSIRKQKRCRLKRSQDVFGTRGFLTCSTHRKAVTRGVNILLKTAQRWCRSLPLVPGESSTATLRAANASRLRFIFSLLKANSSTPCFSSPEPASALLPQDPS